MAIINLTVENFDETIKNGKTLVDFFATWCGPCKMLAPVIEEVAAQASGYATVAKVDVDQERTLAIRYNISSIPTIIVFENGLEINRLVGIEPKETYLAAIK